MEHKSQYDCADSQEHAQILSNLVAKVDYLEKTHDRDHKRLEEDIAGIRAHDDEQDKQVTKIMHRLDSFSALMQRYADTADTSAEETKFLHESLETVRTDVAIIKEDMERGKQNKKMTFQTIMSIITPVITTALILWLGLN